uniref:Beta-defensin-like domain-containing protein n=1 Tax=Terrapene triunguis TaxID=2587831 RepID=A0A674J5Z5_9SAUR
MDRLQRLHSRTNISALLGLPVPSAGLSLPADTLRCINNNGFCYQTRCPGTLFEFGTCSHGRATCCKGRW